MSFWVWVLDPRLAATLAVLGGLLVLWCLAMLFSKRLPCITAGGKVADGIVGIASGVMGGIVAAQAAMQILAKLSGF